MASNRMISTAIWSDERFTDLTANAQLVYLRLVTGDDTTAAGATEVRPKRVAVDTNLERAEVEAALAELIESGLVRRYDDWLWMPTWIKYQVHGPAFIRSARRAARGCPDSLRKAIGRAIDGHVGPSRDTGANTHDAEAATTPDAPRTRKRPTSREKVEGPPEGPPDPHVTVSRGSGDPSERDQDQDQDPDPLRGSGGPSGPGDVDDAHDEPLGSLEGPAALDGRGMKVKGHGEDDGPRRVDLDALAASSPVMAAGLARARAAR